MTRRVGFIYEHMCTETQVKAAIFYASEGKTGRKDVQWVLKNIDHCVAEVLDLLITETYTPAPYIHMRKVGGSDGKIRDISAPKFYPDQIIHWCIYLELKKYLWPTFSPHCYACIKNRGQIYGKKYVERQLRNKAATKYCLKLDVKKFYPSVDTDKLLILLARKIKDPKLLNLLRKIFALEPGLPIGIVLSQILGNFFLSEVLDHKYESAYYNRWADDIVIFGPNKRKLHKLYEDMAATLREWGLEFNNKRQIFRVDDRAVDFMGFRFEHGRTILRKRNIKKIHRAVAAWQKNKSAKAAKSFMSYWGWIKHSDTYDFYTSFIRKNVNFKELKKTIRKDTKRCELTNQNQMWNQLRWTLI